MKRQQDRANAKEQGKKSKKKKNDSDTEDETEKTTDDTGHSSDSDSDSEYDSDEEEEEDEDDISAFVSKDWQQVDFQGRISRQGGVGGAQMKERVRNLGIIGIGRGEW